VSSTATIIEDQGLLRLAFNKDIYSLLLLKKFVSYLDQISLIISSGRWEKATTARGKKFAADVVMNLILLDHSHQVGSEPAEADRSVDDQDERTLSKSNESPLEFELIEKDPRAKHITKHLKKVVGDRLRVGLFPNGPLGQAVVQSTTNNGVRLRLDMSTLRPPQQRPLVRVLLGVPYPKVIKALWSVLASFGVDQIAYAKAALTEPNFLETSNLTPPVYEPLLREGLAQGEDTRPPRVTIFPKTVSVLDLLSSSSLSQSSTGSASGALTKDCCKIVLHIGENMTPTSIRQCYQQSTSYDKGILLAIGPERGWTDEEATAFHAAGFVYASLGDPILRTDTAVVASIALARDVLMERKIDVDTCVHTGKRVRESVT